MPPINRTDLPYPLRTIDGEVNATVDNLTVDGDAVFNGTVTIPGGISFGPQPFFTATDTIRQYRTTQTNLDFQTASATPRFNFKNASDSTLGSEIYSGRVDLTSTLSTPLLSLQTNLADTTTSTAGFKATCATATLTAEIGGASNTSIGNRGVIRTASTAGLDLSASGSSKTIRLTTDGFTRMTVTDNLVQADRPVVATDTSAAVNSASGSIRCAGGVGIAGNVFCDGVVRGSALEVGYAQPIQLPTGYTNRKIMDVQYDSPLFNDATYLYTPGTSGVSSSSTYVLGVNKLGARIPAVTNSTTTGTGALVVDGGAGIAGDVHIGGTVTAGGISAPAFTTTTVSATGSTPTTNFSTGAITSVGGISSQDTVIVKRHILEDQVYAFPVTGSLETSMNLKTALNNKRPPSGDVVQALTTWTEGSTQIPQACTAFCWSLEKSLGVKLTYAGATRAETTVDGINWVTQTIAAETYYAVTWAAGLNLFVGCGLDVIATSPDGITWTTYTSAPIVGVDWRDVVWSPELQTLVVVGNGAILYSTDGSTWTSATSPSANFWFSVEWAPSLRVFCAVAVVGAADRVITSSDGITWVSTAASVNNDWRDVCWSEDIALFVAVAGTGTGDRIMTSPNGTTWTTRTSPFDNLWYSVTWSKDLQVFAASAITNIGSNSIMYSFDGVNWILSTVPIAGGLSNITWCGQLGRFLCVEDTLGQTILSSLVLPSSKGSLNVSQAHVSASSAGALQLKSGIASTSTTTGALTVDGGVGITGNMHLDGITCNSITTPLGTSFTPTFVTNIAITYDSQEGYCYKIGHLTFVSIRIVTSSAIDNTSSDLTIQSLPFPLAGPTTITGTCVLDNFNIGSSVDFVTATVESINPSIVVFHQSRDNLGITNILSPTTAKSRTILVTLTYVS